MIKNHLYVAITFKVLVILGILSFKSMLFFSPPEKNNISINIMPSATISGTTETCLNSTQPLITFTGSGGTTPYTFTYTINGGANLTVQTTGTNNTATVSANTNAFGVFVYELISVSDGSGDSANENGTATVTISRPEIDFSYDNTNLCSGDSILFTPNVTGNGPFQYNWSFGDGNTSNATSPQHIFEALGCGTENFNVTLTVTDSNGCSNNITRGITIQEKPDIAFDDLDTNFGEEFNNCGNNTTDPEYTINVGNISSSTCVTSYDIDWGDGSTATNVSFPLTHTYNELGSFNMQITGYGTNGCNNTVNYLIKNSSNPIGAIEIPGNTVNLCLPVDAIDFAIGSWGTNPPDTFYNIDYGDGTVVNYSQADLEASTYFNASDPANSDNFPIPHTYTESNCPNPNYTVNLAITSSCGESLLTAGPIIILERPEVDFEVDPINCVDTAVQFTNTTIGGFNQNCNTDAAFYWDFGDGNTSNLENPSHVYTAPGTYTVSLYSENFCGETPPIEKTVCIEPPLNPTFDLSSNNGCSALQVAITNTTDLSQSCGGDEFLWEVTYASDFCGTAPEDWSFVNSTDENSTNPEINFVTPGNYTITLTATNSCGPNTLSQTVEIKSPPQATLDSIDDSCGTATINPVATIDTCAPDTETVTYSWSFPGGTPATSNVLDPGTITYANPGDYTVTFTITNDCGSQTVTEMFTVNEIPVITNTNLSQSICSGTETSEIVFTSNPTATSYTWTSNSPAGVTGYIPSGTSNSIPVQTIFNTNATASTLIYTVIPSLNGCEGDPVNFEIIINPSPEITQQPQSSSVCLGGTATDLSINWQGSGTPTYQWYSNTVNSNTGGTIITGATNTTYTPPTNIIGITYYYCVITFSTGGCNEIISEVAQVEVVEAAQINTNPIDTQTICEGGTADTLEVTITGGTGNITYQWYSNTTNSNTGGSAIIGATNATYAPPVFNTAGSYYFYVEISVEGSGCAMISSTVSEVIVIPDPTIDTQPIQLQELCQNAMPVDLQVVVSGGAGNISYQWFSNTTDSNTGGTLITGATNATYTPPTNAIGTLYYYCVITQDVSGCETVSNTALITVLAAPTITSQPLDQSVCINGSLTDLTVAYTNGTGTPTYQWYENTIDDTTSGTAITGATTATYSPPSATIGITYYYCIITFNSGGCNEIISETAEIEVVDNPQIDTQPIANQSICVGGNSENLTITHSGGTGTITYQWYSNTTNSTTGGTLIAGATNATYTPPTFNTAGTFYFYVEVMASGNGCANAVSDIAEITVVPDPIIDSQPLTSQEICQNAASQDLEVMISGGLGNVSYQWFSNTTNSNTGGTLIAGATNATFTPPTDTVGTLYYYCVISQDVSGCEVISTVSTVIVTPAPAFNLQPISDTLCFGETTATLNVAYTNGTGTPSYQWYVNTVDDTTSGTIITGATSATYDPPVDAVGTNFYYCVITFTGGGCSEIISDTAEITINETPNISSTDILICSDNTFEYIPDASSGDTVPTGTVYTWTNPTINPAGSITGASAQTTPTNTISQLLVNTTTNPAIVTYTVVPTAGDCEGDSFTVTVTVNPSISVVETVTNNSCFQSNNASIEITISGGVPFTNGDAYQISWTGPNGFTSTDEDIFNLEAGTYTLTIDDAGGCPFSETYTITEPDELLFSVIDFNPETISCFGANDGEIGITVTGGTLDYIYTWTKDGQPFSNDEDLTDLGPGQYEITVTDANNCGPIVETFEIIEPPLLQATLLNQTDIICFGDSTGAIEVTVSGGRPDYTFSWTGPNGYTNNTQNITDLAAGIYTLTVTDQSACEATLEVTLMQNPEIAIDVTVTEISCYGADDASITINNISGGVPGYTIAWSNFGQGMVQDNLSAGTYIITITDSENCEKQFPITIEEAPVFLIDPVVNQISCFGANDASITLNLVGGLEPIDVSWSDDPNAGVERNNLAPGTYTVTITDSTPCVIEQTFTIFQVDELTVSANVTNALDCDDVNSGAINTLIEGGTPPYTISWSNGATTEDLDNIPPGTYYITIIDANGCTVEGNWEVIRFEPITLDVETETEFNCETKTVNQSFVAQSSGGVPPFNFSWSDGTVSGANNEIMTTTQNGLIILTATDSLGCIATYEFNVDIPELGEPGFTSTSIGYDTFGVYSISDPIQFTNQATGDYSAISWNFGDGNFSNEENPIHIYVAEGTYIVTQTVTYPFGCVYTHVITLIVEKGYSLIMPNGFTPNEDGLNDYFGPEQKGLDNMKLDIYDTWGSLIYSETGDDIRGWDGKIKDNYAENGNYYFKFSASTFYGKVIKEKGAFVFIK